MSTVELDGIAYRTVAKMPAFEQFHVMRRLAPVLAVLGVNAALLLPTQRREEAKKEDVLSFLQLLGPLAEVIAKLSNEDADYVLNACMSKFERRVSENQWQKIMPSPGQFMFDDIDMRVMLRLMSAAIEENLGDFLRGLSGGQPSRSA